jgi:hypothetical protein
MRVDRTVWTALALSTALACNDDGGGTETLSTSTSTSTGESTTEGTSESTSTTDDPSTTGPGDAVCGDGTAAPGAFCYKGAPQVALMTPVGALALLGGSDAALVVGSPGGVIPLSWTGSALSAGAALDGATQVLALASGDFDGDGLIDVVASDATEGSLIVFFGTGDDFTVGAALEGLGEAPRALASGDFDGDGALDVAAALEGQGLMAALLGDGAGGFAPAITAASGTAPLAARSGQINGDAREDLVVANLGSGTVTVFLGEVAGFGAPSVVSTAGGPRAAALGAMSVGEAVALVTVTADPHALLRLPGDGEGGFSPEPAWTLAAAPRDVGLGDLDGDGDLDVAVVLRSPGRVVIFENKAGALGEALTLTTLPDAAVLGIKDLNGDGLPELLVGSDGPNGGLMVFVSDP